MPSHPAMLPEKPSFSSSSIIPAPSGAKENRATLSQPLSTMDSAIHVKSVVDQES